MDNKYIFFIDVDETLIETGKTNLSPKIVQEIQRLKNNGHIFVVSTGRAMNATLAIQGIEVFQYLSVLLGQCIYRTADRCLLTKPESIPKNVVLNLIRTLDNSNQFWSYKDIFIEKSLFKAFESLKKKAGVKFIEKDEFLNDLNNGNIIQMLFDGYLPEDEEVRYPDLAFYKMPFKYTDVALKTASKAKCIDFFKTMYPGYITVSIGDSINDIAMFENTDISIAMGNSSPDIKKLTTYVTKNLNDNGLIYAFKDILKL